MLAPRTCSELGSYGVNKSGVYFIDPDGPKNGSKPVELFCDFESDATEVGHDKDEQVFDIDHCATPGCFKINFNYEAEASVMQELIEQSDYCEQLVTYECLMAPLAYGTSTFLASWTDKNGKY